MYENDRIYVRKWQQWWNSSCVCACMSVHACVCFISFVAVGLFVFNLIDSFHLPSTQLPIFVNIKFHHACIVFQNPKFAFSWACACCKTAKHNEDFFFKIWLILYMKTKNSWYEKCQIQWNDVHGLECFFGNILPFYSVPQGSFVHASLFYCCYYHGFVSFKSELLLCCDSVCRCLSLSSQLYQPWIFGIIFIVYVCF